jgi:signal transduction histidine kinase
MTASFLFRLLCLILLLSLFVGGTAAFSWRAWNQTVTVQERFAQFEQAALHNQMRLSQMVQAMHRPLIRFLFARHSSDWLEFKKNSEQLSLWIADAPLSLKFEDSTLTETISSRFTTYQQAVRQVGTAPILTEGGLRRLDELADALELAFAAQSAAHSQSLARTVEISRDAINRVRWMLGVSSLLVIGLMIWIGYGIYRDHVRPLRTTLVLAEQALEKKEKLAALGTLTAGVAHEVRNPLTAIKARLYTLKLTLKKDSPELQDIQAINDEIARLEALVQDILLFGRHSAPSLQETTVGSIFQGVHALVAPDARSHHITVIIDPTTPLQQSFRCDPHQIKQVLLNLIRNAVEAIHNGGTITLRAKTTPPASPQHIVLEVADTGSGISPEVRERLFDPYFTTKPSGTGLGLYLCARLSEQHGGSIECETKLGKGSTFRIKLPLP